MEGATLWNEIKMNFMTRFSDGRYKYRHRMEVEHCWPDVMNGTPNAQQSAERATQKDKSKDSWTAVCQDINQKYLHLKAKEQLMEYPNATWNDFQLIILKRMSCYKYARLFA